MRVLRTAKQMGKKVVAVYSSADARSAHVEQADEAYHIGPASSSESYLRGDVILDVARRSGAQAIHPGYGFLSENAGFADACAKNEVVFIGPPSSAIRAMGDKKASKILMDKAGVPIVPGYHGEDQSVGLLKAEAVKIGFPVLIKATMGGGGKGMRIVLSEAEFESKLEAAKREAMSSFGDDTVLLERFVLQPRHVEVQVFGDEYGNAVHLFERDCSVQRRHQKVLEESPAPLVTDEFRNAIGQAAVNAALAVGYVGAGTVEFVVGRDLDFYFMEMNTRLQVEHPVTEMVTQEDLVYWQLTVAAGLPLPKKQSEVKLHGHAFETRIYAESPEKDFLPGSGTVARLSAPSGPNIRVDTGVREGDNVGVFYDPMISKLITWAPTRSEALLKMDSALSSYLLAGLPTNINFLRNICKHPEFVKGGVATDFIEKHKAELLPPPATGLSDEMILCAVGYCLQQDNVERDLQQSLPDPHSPWATAHGFRTNLSNRRLLEFVDADSTVDVVVHYNWDGSFRVEGEGRTANVSARMTDDGKLLATLGNLTKHADYFCIGRSLHLWCDGVLHHHQVVLPNVDLAEVAGSGGSIVAPMAGKIIKFAVNAGDAVKKGQTLVIMEAMKMEHTLVSPGDGTVEAVFGKVGEVVEDGKKLVVIAADDEAEA